MVWSHCDTAHSRLEFCIVAMRLKLLIGTILWNSIEKSPLGGGITSYRRIKPDDLTDAIQQELSSYQASLQIRLNTAALKAMKRLVQLTRSTAPRGHRGAFAKSIKMEQRDYGRGKTQRRHYFWCVRPPEHRLAHLLVNGHATRDGGRTRADPFLKNALDQVLPDYEREVETIVGGDK